jgi:hypothetical protein
VVPTDHMRKGTFLTVSCESTLICHAAGTTNPVATDDGGRIWVTTRSADIVSAINAIACPEVTRCVGVAQTTSTGSITVDLSD